MFAPGPDTAAVPYVMAIAAGVALIGLAAVALYWARRAQRRLVMIIAGCVIALIAVGVLVAWHGVIDQQAKHAVPSWFQN